MPSYFCFALRSFILRLWFAFPSLTELAILFCSCGAFSFLNSVEVNILAQSVSFRNMSIADRMSLGRGGRRNIRYISILTPVSEMLQKTVRSSYYMKESQYLCGCKLFFRHRFSQIFTEFFTLFYPWECPCNLRFNFLCLPAPRCGDCWKAKVTGCFPVFRGLLQLFLPPPALAAAGQW